MHVAISSHLERRAVVSNRRVNGHKAAGGVQFHVFGGTEMEIRAFRRANHNWPVNQSSRFRVKGNPQLALMRKFVAYHSKILCDEIETETERVRERTDHQICMLHRVSVRGRISAPSEPLGETPRDESIR